jgi:hypothetical protein
MEIQLCTSIVAMDGVDISILDMGMDHRRHGGGGVYYSLDIFI